MAALGHMLAHMADRPLSQFTLPYQFVTWMWVLGAQSYSVFPTSLGSPQLVIPTVEATRGLPYYTSEEVWLGFCRGIGEVFFFESATAGESRVWAFVAYSNPTTYHLTLPS